MKFMKWLIVSCTSIDSLFILSTLSLFLSFFLFLQYTFFVDFFWSFVVIYFINMNWSWKILPLWLNQHSWKEQWHKTWNEDEWNEWYQVWKQSTSIITLHSILHQHHQWWNRISSTSIMMISMRWLMNWNIWTIW